MIISAAGYLQTDDTALANTLALCGCLPPKDEQGRPVPQIMTYDPATLRRLGYKGMTADEAARLAMRDGMAGVRIFQFEASPLVDRIVKAHNQVAARLKEGGGIHLADVEPEAVAGIVLAANQMRRKMLSAWKIPALIVSGEAGEKVYSDWAKDYRGLCAKTGEVPVDTGFTSSGKLSAISVGASDKLKSEVRL